MYHQNALEAVAPKWPNEIVHWWAPTSLEDYGGVGRLRASASCHEADLRDSRLTTWPSHAVWSSVAIVLIEDFHFEFSFSLFLA